MDWISCNDFVYDTMTTYDEIREVNERKGKVAGEGRGERTQEVKTKSLRRSSAPARWTE
jgi:hypothetical protein